MIRKAGALLAIVATVAVPTAFACFPAPDAKPTSEITALRLPMRPSEPSVIYTAGAYAIYMKPQDLLDVMRGQGAGQFDADTFPGRLQALLPVDSDVDVHAILDALAPETPEAGEKTERALRYRRFWRQSEQQLGFDIAELLESGRAAVVETSSDMELVSLRRNKYAEICFGGRKFIAPDGTVVLHTNDWIS